MAAAAFSLLQFLLLFQLLWLGLFQSVSLWQLTHMQLPFPAREYLLLVNKNNECHFSG